MKLTVAAAITQLELMKVCIAIHYAENSIPQGRHDTF